MFNELVYPFVQSFVDPSLATSLPSPSLLVSNTIPSIASLVTSTSIPIGIIPKPVTYVSESVLPSSLSNSSSHFVPNDAYSYFTC